MPILYLLAGAYGGGGGDEALEKAAGGNRLSAGRKWRSRFRRSSWLVRASRRNRRRRNELIAVPLAGVFLLVSANGAVLGACFALAAATVLLFSTFNRNASDLAPHRFEAGPIDGTP